MMPLHGLYRGVVVSSADPQSRRRLLTRIPQVTGDSAVWALPCESTTSSPSPVPGSGVWVMFEQGDPTKPVWTGVYSAAAASTSGTNIAYVSLNGNDANDGTTWATAKATISEAISSLGGEAGMVDIGTGTFLTSTTTLVPGNVILRGQGVHATKIERTADVPLIDLSGEHPNTTTTFKPTGQALRDLTLDGGGVDAWTSSLLIAWYVAEAMFDHVNFTNSGGAGVDGIEFWDSYFTGCRWTDCSGVTGAGLASVWLRASTGAVSGMGHSNGNVNNLWFVNCVFESFKDGAVNADGTGSQRHNKNYFVNCKLETRKVGGPVVKLDNAEGWYFNNVNLVIGEFRAGYSTPANMFELSEVYGCNFTNVFIETVETPAPTIARGFYALGWVSASTFDGISAVVQTVNKPTALIDWNTGQTSRIGASNIAYSWNPGGAATFVGTVGSFMPPVATPSTDNRVVYVSASGSDSNNDGLTWLTPKRTIDAAVALVSSSGGTVEIGSGTFDTATTLVIPSEVKLRGQGVRNTTIRRTANVPLLDLSGSHPLTTTTVTSRYQSIENLTLDGGSTYTTSLVVAWYVSGLLCDRVEFANSSGAAIDGIEIKDSTFRECRWNDASGRAGTGVASVWLRSDTGAVTGPGHSTDTSYGLRFDDCTWDWSRDGAVRAIGTGGRKINKVQFVNCRIDTDSVSGPPIKVYNVEGWNFVNVNVKIGAFNSGYTTPVNLFELEECYGSNFTNIRLETYETASATIANGIYALGWTALCTFVNITGLSQTVNKPTALINWNTSQTSRNGVTNIVWQSNPGNSPLFAGAPSSLLPIHGLDQNIRPNASYTLTSTTVAQKAFNTPFNGRVDVEAATTYEFEGRISLSSMSATSGAFGFALGGTATFTSLAWHSIGTKAATLSTATALQGTYNTTASNTAVVTATTDTSGWVTVRGAFRVNAAGTVIPQVSLGVAADAVVGVDSFFRLWPSGSNTVQYVGDWS